MRDEVEAPAHYEGATVDSMTALASMLNAGEDIDTGEGIEGRVTPAGIYWWGCAFKYLWRWSRKGGLQDLRKARRCIDYLIGEVYGPDALSDG